MLQSWIDPDQLLSLFRLELPPYYDKDDKFYDLCTVTWSNMG